MTDFIAYYRVSTDRQGASGLGLDAQRQSVAGYIGSGRLIAEYTEIESGKRHSNRPQLLTALVECRKRRAVLLIARLDRLARNVAFIANLMESGVDFVAVDIALVGRESQIPSAAGIVGMGGNYGHPLTYRVVILVVRPAQLMDAVRVAVLLKGTVTRGAFKEDIVLASNNYVIEGKRFIACPRLFKV